MRIRSGRALLGAIVAWSVAGCASLGGDVPALDAALEAPTSDQLQVRLAFPAAVDLDLYVSDPLLETVYYANTPSRSGGRLAEDARCKGAPDAGMRVERVHFELRQPGRYRIGVDFPEACDGDSEAPFVVRVDVGGRTRTASGVAQLLDFDSRVLEFELDASGSLAP